MVPGGMIQATQTVPSVDLLRPFQLERSQLRGRFVRLGGTVDYVLKAHDYPPAVSDLLGQLLVLAGALAGGLKFAGRFSLQIRGRRAGPAPGRRLHQRRRDARLCQLRRRARRRRCRPSGRWTCSARASWRSPSTSAATAASCSRASSSSAARRCRTACSTTSTAPSRSAPASGSRWRKDPLDGRWLAGAIVMQALPVTDPRRLHDAEEDWRRAMILLGTATDDELLDPDTAARRSAVPAVPRGRRARVHAARRWPPAAAATRSGSGTCWRASRWTIWRACGRRTAGSP